MDTLIAITALPFAIMPHGFGAFHPTFPKAATIETASNKRKSENKSSEHPSRPQRHHHHGVY